MMIGSKSSGCRPITVHLLANFSLPPGGCYFCSLVPIIAACLILTAAYMLLMLIYRAGWSGQPVFRTPADYSPGTPVSVIIPARNEAAVIRACLRSVLDQDYPDHLLEVIVVDDHSEDDT